MLRGEVVFIYAFDVAHEIRSLRLPEIFAARATPLSLREDRTTPKTAPFYKPYTVELPSRHEVEGAVSTRLSVRIYDIGVVTVLVRAAFKVDRLIDLMPFHNAKLSNGSALEVYAASINQEVTTAIASCLINPGVPPAPEAYTVFCVTEVDGIGEDVHTWFETRRREASGLLTETAPELLSEAQVHETLRIIRSFEIRDILVIDWDAALTIDLSGYVEDIIYVLEVANVQLEEFRIVDAQLDQHLDQAYRDFQHSKSTRFALTGRTLHALRRIRIEATRLTDEVTNISKFFGDWYLARAYLGARNRFHLDHWKEGVEGRLAHLDQLYSVLHAETNERRMLVLEATIVVLFIVDLIALFLYPHKAT